MTDVKQQVKSLNTAAEHYKKIIVKKAATNRIATMDKIFFLLLLKK